MSSRIRQNIDSGSFFLPHPELSWGSAEVKFLSDWREFPFLANYVEILRNLYYRYENSNCMSPCNDHIDYISNSGMTPVYLKLVLSMKNLIDSEVHNR